LMDTKLEIHKDKTLREATEKAREVRWPSAQLARSFVAGYENIPGGA
jgi:hypothetical protein